MPRIRNLDGRIDWDRGDYGLHVLAGREQEYRHINADGTGFGLPTANNGGCFLETTTNSTTVIRAGNTRRIQQLTLGVWDTFCQGSFGRAQWSYIERQLFAGVGGMSQTHNTMGFISFRYYPFSVLVERARGCPSSPRAFA